MRMSFKGLTVAVISLGLWAAPVSAQDESGEPITLTITERSLQDTLEQSGGLAVLRFKKGDRITLVWETDETTELHLHGYDIDLNLEAGHSARMEFDADFTGRFALEAHSFLATALLTDEEESGHDDEAEDAGHDDEAEDAGHDDEAEDAEDAGHDDEDVILIYIEVLPN